MRSYKAVMHFNKAGAQVGTPWTVHFRGVCYVVKTIRCLVPMTSEFKPGKKSNPRAFFTARVTNFKVTSRGIAVLS